MPQLPIPNTPDEITPEWLTEALRSTGILRKLEDLALFVHDELTKPPWTIVHCDFRLENLFFDVTEDASSLAVIDWQMASRGCGVYDVAYLMGFGLLPEQRKASEMDTLTTYHETLVGNGV